jgi:hypothetical protein
MQQPSRRAALQKLLFGAGLMVWGVARTAEAERNTTVRAELKYQERSNSKRHCASCAHFRPGAGISGFGRCELIAADDEINPAGVCGLWTNS